ncbi:MAG TPA: hypothetical protein VK217_06965 [Acidimicrobiales bacterium]|nr:hypothetical protein [Acidimicrobiales bacterium]
MPVDVHTEALFVFSAQFGQGLVHAAQVRRPVVRKRQHHADQKGPRPQLAVAHTDRQQRLDELGDA